MSWVHWHNTTRLHGYLDDLPPAEFEAIFYAPERPTKHWSKSNSPSLYVNQGDSFQVMAAASGPSLDSGRIQPRSTRWIVGVAMLVISAALALSSFMDWAHLSYPATDGYGGYTKVSAELSGFGAVSVSIPNVKDAARRSSAEEQEASALKVEGPKVGLAPM